MNHLKVGVIMLLLAGVIIAVVFALVVSFVLKKDHARINWIENEFYRRQNAERVTRLSGEVRDLQKDGE